VAEEVAREGARRTNWARALLLASIVLGQPAQAATVRVAANGSDVPGCGSKRAPCLTLGMGIERARPGDTVRVGPGYYVGPPSSCGNGEAAVCIDKSIRVLSTDGATSTVIHGPPMTVFPDAIAIIAPGVVLGKPGHGFTIRSSSGHYGVRVEAPRARIAGNLLVGNLEGVQIASDDAVVSKNLALSNGLGFVTLGSRNVLRNLTASANKIGFFVFLSGAGGQQLRDCLAVANEVQGLAILSNGAGGVGVERSAALGNETGVHVEGAGAPVRVERSNLSGSASSCGLDVTADAVVEAPHNFWGAPTGPGADPADSVCAEPGASAVATPAARRPFRVQGAGALP
jgi:Right handed beta helix region